MSFSKRPAPSIHASATLFEDFDRANCIVTWDNVVDAGWVTVGVYQCNDWDSQLARFSDCDVLTLYVDIKIAPGSLFIPDTAEVTLKLFTLAVQVKNFLLGQLLECSIFSHLLDVGQAVDALTNGAEVGEEATEPAVVDEELVGLSRRLLNDGLSLTLRSDEKNALALRS